MKKLLVVLFAVSACFADLQYNTEFENLENGDTLDYDLHLHPPLDSIKNIFNGGLDNTNISDGADIRQSKIDSVKYVAADWIWFYTRFWQLWSSGTWQARFGRGATFYINDTTANDGDFAIYCDSTKLLFIANDDSVYAPDFRCDTLTADSADVFYFTADTMSIDSAYIKDAKIDTATVDSAQIGNLTVNTITADSVWADTLKADTLHVAAGATMTTLNTDSAHVGYMTADTARIDTLDVSKAEIDTLDADTVRSLAFDCDRAWIDSAKKDLVVVGEMRADTVRAANNLAISNANFAQYCDSTPDLYMGYIGPANQGGGFFVGDINTFDITNNAYVDENGNWVVFGDYKYPHRFLMGEQTGIVFFTTNYEVSGQEISWDTALVIEEDNDVRVPSGGIHTEEWTDISGSCTQTGWAATPTVVVYRWTLGKLVYLQYNITGTSNSTAAGLTVPDTIASGFDGYGIGFGENNGSDLADPIYVTMSSADISFGKNYAASSWTDSGTKTVKGIYIYIRK